MCRPAIAFYQNVRYFLLVAKLQLRNPLLESKQLCVVSQYSNMHPKAGALGREKLLALSPKL